MGTRRASWIVVVLAVLACTAVLPAPPAAAVWGRIPRVTVVTPRDSGHAHVYSSSESRRSGRFCMAGHGDGIRSYGPPVLWLPEDELAVRFHTSARPDDVRVEAYLVGDPVGNVPVFGQMELQHGLRRARVDGKVVWEAVLDAPPAPDLYIDVTASWDPPGWCSGYSGSWAFRAGILPL